MTEKQLELFDVKPEDKMAGFMKQLKELDLESAVVIGFGKDKDFHLLASSGSLTDIFMYSNLAISSASNLVIQGPPEAEIISEDSKVLN